MAPGAQKPRSGPRGSLTPASTDIKEQGAPETAQTPASDADTATAGQPVDPTAALREAAADDQLAPAPVHYKRRKPASKTGSTEPEAVEPHAAGTAAVANAVADAIADAAEAAVAGLAGPSGAVDGAAAADDDEDVESTALATNLGDPDCTPGTAEFAAAKDKNTTTLEAYQDRLNYHASNQEAKPDMIAYSKLRAQYTPPVPIYGHIPGVKVGDEFSGRGELAILGLHTEMMRGIMASAKHGPAAYAICLAGGYIDDADEGSTFWYTGQGGQKKNKQTDDQSFETRDNAALVENVKTSTPVRVFRGKQANKDGKVERKYVYEGLYKVTEYKREPSKDGPLVCRYKMEAIPGHSAVTGKVDYKIFGRNPFRVRDLANTAARRRTGSKRGRAPGIKLWSRAELEALIVKRAAEGANGRLVNPDIAQGMEKVPIPVWNSIDDDDSILAPEPEGFSYEFMYIADYKFGHETAKKLAVEAENQFGSQCGSECGIQYGGGGEKHFVNYTNDGLLMCTHPCGVMECDPTGQDCEFKQCQSNNVVLSGLRYPLEIFKVSKQKRWGVRCPVDLPIGAVICPYIGLVIHDHKADELRNQDLYLFDLNHYHQLADAEDGDNLPDVGMNPRMPELPRSYREKHLVIDAHIQGNVGRFINHSCQPNCLVQTVFAGYARSYLLYYIVIVASEDIPAFTEITYDYCYSRGGGRVPDAQSPVNNTVRINCNCGAPNCNGRLI